MWQYNYHNSDSLQHANRFQYIAKVKLPNGGSRYFYTEQEYASFLKNGTQNTRQEARNKKRTANIVSGTVATTAGLASGVLSRGARQEARNKSKAVGNVVRNTRDKARYALPAASISKLNTNAKSTVKRASTVANKSPFDLKVERLASKYPERRQQAVNTIAEKAVKPTVKKGRELNKKISKAVNNYPEYRERAVNTLAEKVVKPTMKKGEELGETAVDVVKNPGKYVDKAKKNLNDAIYNYPENYNRAVNTIADKAVKPTIQKGHELEAKVSDVVNNYPEYRNQVVKWLADNAATPAINWSKDKIDKGKKLLDDWMAKRRRKRSEQYTREVLNSRFTESKSTKQPKKSSTKIKKENYNPSSPAEDVTLIAPDVVQNASWDIERRLKRR